jgi:hypothetical protein
VVNSCSFYILLGVIMFRSFFLTAFSMVCCLSASAVLAERVQTPTTSCSISVRSGQETLEQECEYLTVVTTDTGGENIVFSFDSTNSNAVVYQTVGKSTTKDGIISKNIAGVLILVSGEIEVETRATGTCAMGETTRAVACVATLENRNVITSVVRY